MKYRLAKCFAFLTVILLAAASLRAQETIDPSQGKVEEGVRWFDIRLLSVEGQGWTDVKAPYDRLPGKAEGVVPAPVWGLSRDSAGLCVRFTTASQQLQARWTLTRERLAMEHMPATGVSGLDLYVKTDKGWRWLSVGRPTKPQNTAMLFKDIPAGAREYLLYLPLYNGVSSVEIGLPEAAALAKAPARDEATRKPIVFYGTSITQGGCASRPGMVHTAILGRKLDRPVINLGFSGNGRMEPALADLLAELDPAVYVLDCLPNLGPEETAQRVEPFVKNLRAARPATPILLVEDRFYEDSFLIVAKRERNDGNHKALKAAYDRLRAAEVPGLYYLAADMLLGDDGEATVDSSHPTDLGFLRQADAFQPALAPLLK